MIKKRLTPGKKKKVRKAKPAAGTKGEEGSESNKQGQLIPAEVERGVFVKLKVTVKEKLDDIVRDYDKTLAEAITQLILAFHEQTPTEQEYIMTSAGQAALLTRLEYRVGDLQAADHSFSLRRWIRTIEDHERLLESPATLKEAKQRFESWAEYRLAFVWIDIAYERRAAGINSHPEKPNSEETEDGWELQYDLAIAALRQSIEYGLNVRQPMQNVATFNLACARSLLGQYLVERALLAGEINTTSNRPEKGMAPDEFLDSMKIRFFEEVKSPPTTAKVPGVRPKERTKFVATKVYDWLTERRPADHLCRLVQVEADAALQELNDVYKQRGGSGEEATLSWLLDSMSKDNDLDFLRTAELYKRRFDNFLSILRDHGDTVTAWCQKKLHKFLPGQSGNGSTPMR